MRKKALPAEYFFNDICDSVAYDILLSQYDICVAYDICG